jgi:hypothetical protein
VEARGVEPLSEDRQHTASTCVADNLNSRPSTPIGRLRTVASPECSRPQAAEHQPWTSPLHRALPPPRASDGRTSQLIKLRVPVLDWQLHFPGVNESPRARHATVVSVSPSKPVAPFPSDVEKDLISPAQPRRAKTRPPSGVLAALKVSTYKYRVRFGFSLAALLNGRFEQPAGMKQVFSCRQLFPLDCHDTAGVKGDARHS